MTEGTYILPRVQNSANHVSIIDMESLQEPSPKHVVLRARQAFNSGKTKPYQFRRQQLKNLLKFLEENGPLLNAAIHADLKKPTQESQIFETDALIGECKHTLANLKAWMQPETLPKTLFNYFDGLRIYSDPLGVVLVMGAWNYPLNLTLSPALGAIAAGNCCVIKPSDLSPHLSQFLLDNLGRYIDGECYPVFQGGVPETTDLLKERFDYIFYTGSTAVGKIVHKAAANFLTPTTLELGGKSPTYIDSTADLDLATKRIIWGKFTNCGQTCVAPDYILCTKSVQEKFLEYSQKYIKEFFGSNIKQSKDFGRIVNERHFNRICNLMRNQKIAIGGNVDIQDLYISPTILIEVQPEEEVMQEEIFGPVLPILTVPDAQSAVNFINSRAKPLALYLFTSSDKVKELFLNNTSSGGVLINDTLMHLAVPNLPFGGVGMSGMGSYHGKKSFDTFVHKKSVLVKGFGFIGEKTLQLRYPPYTDKGTKLASMAVKHFNRNTFSVTKCLTYVCVFGLGVGVTVGGYYLKRYFEGRE